MNTTYLITLSRLFFTGILMFAPVLAYAGSFRAFNPSNPTDPYGFDLPGETVITSTGYNYHHWGVLLDETTTAGLNVPFLSFTRLSTANGLFGLPGTFPLN